MVLKDRSSSQELYTCAADTSDKRKVSGELLAGTHVGRDEVAWSPDGTRIAYVAYQSTYGLYVSAPDGSNNHKVSNDLAWDVGVLRWHPDGTRIAFIEFRNNRVGLYTTLPDGADPKYVSDSLSTNPFVQDFRWSPDGTQIAYLARDDNTTPEVLQELHLSRSDGSDDRPIKPDGSAYEIKWSPSGEHVAFVWRGVRPASLELYTSTANGDVVRRVNGPFGPGGSSISSIGRRWMYGIEFGWSPDGSRIAYITRTDSPDSKALYTNTDDGSDEQRVSEPVGPTGHIWSFAWSPAPITP